MPTRRAMGARPLGNFATRPFWLPLPPQRTYKRGHRAGAGARGPLPEPTMANVIYVLNGPNLNLLGTREPETYGRATLKDVEALCRAAATRHKLDLQFRQSSYEGEIIEWIHEAAARTAVGIVINAGAYTHTSIAIHDALRAAQLPVVEVHVSNVFARESFRHHSYIAPVANASLCGFGIEGYALAIMGLVAIRENAAGRRG
jgi:3-dehydroquinate dehydratase-2